MLSKLFLLHDKKFAICQHADRVHIYCEPIKELCYNHQISLFWLCSCDTNQYIPTSK